MHKMGNIRNFSETLILDIGSNGDPAFRSLGYAGGKVLTVHAWEPDIS